MKRFWLLATLLAVSTAQAEVVKLESGAWRVEHEIVVTGSPEVVYDAFTGDVSGWWDHTMSENPKSLVIEAKPGGQFLEIFDDSGDGAEHARVIYAKRGELLRMRGPLGLSGFAIDMVYSISFAADGEQTRVKLDLKGAGEFDQTWAEAVDGVWHHFLVERFQAYVEAGKHLE